MLKAVFEYLPKLKVVLPGDADNKFKFMMQVQIVWEECEWMVKYKLECVTLECVCGAVFEAWVASGRGEREEWLESTSEGGSAQQWRRRRPPPILLPTHHPAPCRQDLWNPGPVQCRSHPNAIQINLNRLSSVEERHTTTNTNPTSNSSPCAVLKSPYTPIQMDLYMIGQVQGNTGNPSPSSSSNELETLP